MKSIQTKILVVVISGLLVLTIIVTAISVTMMHSVMHDDADRILNNMCQKEAIDINETLRNIETASAIMEHYASTELDSVEHLRSERYRDEYLDKLEAMFNEIAWKTKYLEAFYVRINPEYSTNSSGFFTGIRDDGTFTELPQTDMSLYAPDDIEHVGWYYAAVEAGKGVWMQPYNNLNMGKVLISYVAPFYCDGMLAGTIGIDMDFDQFVKYVNNIHVYKEGKAYLISTDGKTAYNTDLSPGQLGNSAHPHTWATAMLDNGMSLMLTADYSDIQRDIRPMLNEIIMAFGFVLIVFILITVVATRRMIAPLKKLIAAAQSISEGKDVSDFSFKATDEIGLLANTLRNTYVKLQEYTNYVNALAYRDSLTGLKNRTAYVEAIEALNEKIRCGDPAFAVLVADINNLKVTNDRYGHEAGNELIVHAAHIMQDVFKSSSIYRIGGDELVVILEGQDHDAYRLRLSEMEQMFEKKPVTVQDTEIYLSVATGIALYQTNVDTAYKDVFNNADRAMYLRKQGMKAGNIRSNLTEVTI